MKQMQAIQYRIQTDHKSVINQDFRMLKIQIT